ncbi:MAG: ABC-type transport auxiliary lipoprotein family protein [Candidatus Celaenobacter antarcticus]|nr:ABC-type transport auxiliary lipoprotein family protein [Candidatus Celaenobacter antarcticus]
MKSKNIIIIILAILALGCSRMQWAHFYILDYVPPITKNDVLTTPYPYTVQVKDFKIDKTYDNSRIVIRQSAHEVYYDRWSLWARRPPDAITALIINHIRALNLVHECKKIFLDQRPDYIITGSIHNIEKYVSDLPLNEFQRADIGMTIQMIDVKNNITVVNYEIKRYAPLYTESMSFFAKTLSDTLKNEITIFLRKVQEYFETLQKNQPAPTQGK